MVFEGYLSWPFHRRYDGHSSHIDLKLVELTKNNNITIILFPPHSSHLLQPLDLAIFKSIKTKWDAALCAWTRRHQAQKLPKHELPIILCNIWTKLDQQFIKNGFSKARIYSFNNWVIDKNRFDPKSYKKWVNSPENDNPIDLNIVRIEPQNIDLPGPTENQKFNSFSSTPSYTSFEEHINSQIEISNVPSLFDFWSKFKNTNELFDIDNLPIELACDELNENSECWLETFDLGNILILNLQKYFVYFKVP